MYGSITVGLVGRPLLQLELGKITTLTFRLLLQTCAKVKLCALPQPLPELRQPHSLVRVTEELLPEQVFQVQRLQLQQPLEIFRIVRLLTHLDTVQIPKPIVYTRTHQRQMQGLINQSVVQRLTRQLTRLLQVLVRGR